MLFEQFHFLVNAMKSHYKGILRYDDFHRRRLLSTMMQNTSFDTLQTEQTKQRHIINVIRINYYFDKLSRCSG